MTWGRQPANLDLGLRDLSSLTRDRLRPDVVDGRQWAWLTSDGAPFRLLDNSYMYVHVTAVHCNNKETIGPITSL